LRELREAAVLRRLLIIIIITIITITTIIVVVAVDTIATAAVRSRARLTERRLPLLHNLDDVDVALVAAAQRRRNWRHIATERRLTLQHVVGDRYHVDVACLCVVRV
jgi:hypothetical protein